MFVVFGVGRELIRGLFGVLIFGLIGFGLGFGVFCFLDLVGLLDFLLFLVGGNCLVFVCIGGSRLFRVVVVNLLVRMLRSSVLIYIKDFRCDWFMVMM